MPGNVQSAMLDILKRIQTDVSEMKRRLERVKTDVTDIKGRLVHVEGRLESIDTVVKRMRRETISFLGRHAGHDARHGGHLERARERPGT